MTTLRRALTAVLTAGAVCSGAVAHASSFGPAPIVEQGDRAYFGHWADNPNVCTIGYTDHARGISYVAAHCGSGEVTEVSIADRTNAEDMHFNVGVFYPSPDYAGDSTRGDWGYIRWNSQVHLGPNNLTGNTWLASQNVQPGETVCYYGTTSHTTKNVSSCGTFVHNIDETGSFRYISRAAKVGDSGGPVWVERNDERLFIGVHSATVTTVANDGATTLRLIGTTPDREFLHPKDSGNVDSVTNALGSTTRVVRDPLGMMSSGSSESPKVGAMTVTELVVTLMGLAVIVGLAGPVLDIVRGQLR